MVFLAVTEIQTQSGEWLAAHRTEMERGEAVWLERLAAFDLAEEWAADGQCGCADWLVWRVKMAKATAYEKLQVAHQLRRRPLVAEAFSEGRASYSAVRAICRIDDPDPDVDVSLLMVAEAGSVADVEKAVRFYQLHADQHRPPRDPRSRQSLRCRPNLDGTSTVEVTLADVDAQELLGILQAFVDRKEGVVRDPSPGRPSAVGPVDESARADCGLAPADEPPLSARRAQAVLDMARVALQHLDGPPAAGADRYMIHLVVQDGHGYMLDGTPIEDNVVRRVACDASTVVHSVSSDGEPLALGRRTREWSTAQRRAIMVRDGGRCRFPGCPNRLYVDIHHHHWWSKGGPTDVSNGYVICSHHHGLIHKGGYTVEGDPDDVLTFYRPNGWVIDSTEPRTLVLRA